MRGKLFVISGPSGAGKDTVVNQAIDRIKKDYDIERITTYTTRPPREGEVDGKDYFFISYDDFVEKEKNGFFLETNKYAAGNVYGSPVPNSADLEMGKNFVLVVDINGAKEAAKKFKDTMFIWVAPPDMTTLRNRLEKRGTESHAQVEMRLNQAKHEMEEAHKIRLFEYILVNDIFEQSVEELLVLMKKAFAR
jgi:guanylate kinase